MELKKFDHSRQFLAGQIGSGDAGLGRAEAHLSDGTWPQGDYKELLELVITLDGGKCASLTLKYPGADQHARCGSEKLSTT